MRSQERSDVLAKILLHDRGHLRVEHDLQPASTDVPTHDLLAVGVEMAARVKDAGARRWPVRAHRHHRRRAIAEQPTGHQVGDRIVISLTVQRDDDSVANLVASGLFGDGAAAVVAVGANRPAQGPRVLDSRSHLYPDSEQIMGWDVGAGGLKIVLDAQVPAIVQKYLGQDIRSLLAAHSLQVDDVGPWVSHPGGPKVIEAIEAELGLAGDPLELTWRSLDQIGNLSSSSVLHVLRDTLDKRSLLPGTPGMLMAMGPGFCSELVLLQW